MDKLAHDDAVTALERKAADILESVTSQIEHERTRNNMTRQAMTGLEEVLTTAVANLGEVIDALGGVARGAATAPPVPFTPPVWTPVEPTWGDTVHMEWDACVGADLWTMVRKFTDYGVRWYLYGTAVPSDSPIYLGDSHMEARHTAHLAVRNHYRNVSAEASPSPEES